MPQFEDYYKNDAVVEEYDSLRFSKLGGRHIDQREQSALLGALPSGRAFRVLEIGCGTGRFTQTLLQAGHHVLAIDPSEAMLGKAKAKVALLSESLQDRADFRVGSGLDLAGLPASFDVAVSLRVLIHLKTDEIARLLYEVASKLTAGGILAFDVLNSYSPNVLIAPINLFRHRFSRVNFVSASRLRAIAAENGFEEVAVLRLFVVPQFVIRLCGNYAGPLIALNNWLEKVVPGLASHCFWTLKKV